MIRTVKNQIRRLSLMSMIAGSMLILSSDAMARGKSIYNGAPTEDQCRLCHGDNSGVPNPAAGAINANRHHGLIGKPIEGLYYGWHESVAPGDTSEGVYKCVSCHPVDYSSETDVGTIVLTNDCLQCHPAWSVTGRPMRGDNVHHATQSFQQRQCRSCHSFLSSSGRGGMSRGGRGGRR